MNRLFLVRHGENRANLTREFSYKLVDYSLNARGILQAQQTAAYFKDKPIHAVYSSPLKRAVETADIIGQALGLPVTVIEQFREINVGQLEGQEPTAEQWAFHDRIFYAWLAGDPTPKFPGGEDYGELLDRMQAGIRQALAGRDGQNVIVVGHGGNTTVTLKDICANVDTDCLLRASNPNCSITEIVFENGHGPGELIRWASADHLHGEAANALRLVSAADFEDQPGESGS
jgi:broad specificity phosphatase PhoE